MTRVMAIDQYVKLLYPVIVKSDRNEPGLSTRGIILQNICQIISAYPAPFRFWQMPDDLSILRSSASIRRRLMKKLIIICIALTLLVTGAAMAEPGIPKVNEVQGISTSTTVIAAGNFNTASSVDLVISRVVPITDIPGTAWNGTRPEETIYQTVYTEDTQNFEVGFVSYDKDLDLSTANKVSGQYNVQAVKQITYLGVDASSVITNDYLLLDGTGWGGVAADRLICPFACGT
jgi:hypothetical protein